VLSLACWPLLGVPAERIVRVLRILGDSVGALGLAGGQVGASRDPSATPPSALRRPRTTAPSHSVSRASGPIPSRQACTAEDARASTHAASDELPFDRTL